MSGRFKTGDRIMILPKFSHLYPSASAVILAAKPDPFRSVFDEYTIQFPSGGTADLFEFQLLEDNPDFKTFIATITFDSLQSKPLQQMRGQSSGRHLVLHTAIFDVDLKIEETLTHPSLIGQILERGTASLFESAEVRLMKESIPLATTTSDATGMFNFANAPRGPLNILVCIPQISLRILGTFSV